MPRATQTSIVMVIVFISIVLITWIIWQLMGKKGIVEESIIILIPINTIFVMITKINKTMFFVERARVIAQQVLAVRLLARKQAFSPLLVIPQIMFIYQADKFVKNIARIAAFSMFFPPTSTNAITNCVKNSITAAATRISTEFTPKITNSIKRRFATLSTLLTDQPQPSPRT